MISYKKNSGRLYPLSCAGKSTGFWRKSWGRYIVIILLEPLPMVQSKEVLQTCCIRIYIILVTCFLSWHSGINLDWDHTESCFV